ncbi:acyl carrier protein [Gimesia alba]|uniref:Acyl carrier protein n=1 Tax=Gimesia alba TaxID=2527973 RepID=A0A517RD16_9PLAN|nr:acyl carrier protein [Gimesia alba]
MFGCVAKRIVGLSIATNLHAEAAYNTVFSIVKEIVVEQLGVDDDKVVPTAIFVIDLGVG